RFDVGAQHDVEVIGQLVSLDADEARADAVDGAPEFVDGNVSQLLWEVALGDVEIVFPEGLGAADMVFPQARLRFMGAEADATDGIETDKIGGEWCADIGRVGALLVERVASLMQGTE